MPSFPSTLGNEGRGFVMSHTSPSTPILSRPLEVAVTLMLVAASIGLLAPAVLQVRVPGGAGLPIPKQHPDEANRVYHSSGLSIVLPENGELKISVLSGVPRVAYGTSLRIKALSCKPARSVSRR